MDMRPPIVFEVNGALVALYPMETVQAVALEVQFRAGAWYEKGNDWGAMHLLEHLVHQGTETLLDVYAKELYKEDHGIYQNAYTSGATLGFELNFPTVSLEAGLNLFQELAFHATLPEDRLEHEKQVIAQEYRDKWSNPNSRYARVYDMNLFGDHHIYIRDGMGEIGFVNTVTREDLVKLQKEFFVTNNMVLGLSGNFDVEKTKKLITKMLTDAPHGKSHTYTPGEPKTKSLRSFHSEDVDRVSIDINYFMKGRDETTERERVIQHIANYILGRGGRSRIYKRLRNELGLVYSAGSSLVYRNTVSNFYMGMSVSPENALKAEQEIHSIFQVFLDKGATKEEFTRARNYINMRMLMAYDSPYSIAREMASDLFWDKEIKMPEEYIKMANSITLKEINDSFTSLRGKDPIVSVMARNPLE